MKLGPWIDIYIQKPEKDDRWNRYVLGLPISADQWVSPYVEIRIHRTLFVFGSLYVKLYDSKQPSFKSQAIEHMQESANRK